MQKKLRPFAIIPGAALTSVLLTACHDDHIQSALHSAGPVAQEIAWLWWIMFGILSAVFLGTMFLLALALMLPRCGKKGGVPGGDTRFIVIAGIIVPIVILIALLLASLRSTIRLRTPEEAAVTIKVRGFQWWWHVEYPELGITTANELHVPTGAPVHLVVESADVVHSLWVPNLTSKMDLVPGKTNRFWLQADRAGVWRGQCAEYCGLQHALMALMVVALEPEEFNAWVRHHQTPPAEPQTELALRGRDVFFGAAAGCTACHAIGGTSAQARLAPDLTFLASRLTLGAATIDNEPDLLARWIADSHQFKPGNLMPRTQIDDDELAALVEYLMTLKSPAHD